MKINRESRQHAKRLFSLCRENGRMDESRVREVVAYLQKEQPRNFMAILARFRKLVELEVHARTAVIETATPLGGSESSIRKNIEDRFGAGVSVSSVVRPELLGGLKIRVGSNVWDSSISGRLAALQNHF